MDTIETVDEDSGTRRLRVLVPADLARALETKAKRHKLPLGEVVREVLRGGVAGWKPEATG